MTPLLNLALRLRRRLHRHSAPIFRDIHSVDRFAALMQRERARAERLHEEFSLISFAPQKHQREEECLAQLIKLLRRRLRITDEIGWLGPKLLGVLLPSTPATGAWKVVSDILVAFTPELRLPQCRVYGYPSHWSADGEVPYDLPQRLAGTGEDVYAMEALFIRHTPLWKRGGDILGAAVGLILLLPLLGIIAMLVKRTSPGPILFKQQRSGIGGRRFWMIKFRTMVPDAEARQLALLELNEQDGPAFKLTHDPRVTKIGRVLRKLSLDELPQLWNVLRGEMSLVGPRPLPCHETAGCSVWQRRRLDVVPGLTCIWQIRGRSAVTFPEWVRMDLQYIRQRTLLHDLKLIAATVPAVLFGKGGK